MRQRLTRSKVLNRESFACVEKEMANDALLNHSGVWVVERNSISLTDPSMFRQASGPASLL